MIAKIKNNRKSTEKPDSSVGLKKQTDKPDRSLDSVLNLMDALYKMRLVEHLAMPKKNSQLEPLLQQYANTFQTLNNLLFEIQRQGWKDTQTTVSTKDRSRSRSLKSGGDSKSQHNHMNKEQLKKIELKYIEIFIDGSLKYYPKVAKVKKFTTDLTPIDIEVWVKTCKLQGSYRSECCC